MLLPARLPYCEAARARMLGGLPGVVAGGASAASLVSLVDIVRGLNILCARGWSISSLKSLAAAFRLADSRKGFALCMPRLPEEGSYWYRCICWGYSPRCRCEGSV